MVEKFILSGAGGQTVGLKRNKKTGKTVIGGNGRFLSEMYLIVENCFGKEVQPHVHWITGNKAKLRFSTSPKTWESGVERLSKFGYVCTLTNNLGRIMR